MLEIYLRFAPIATPILILVVIVLMWVIHDRRKRYDADLSRKAKHARNAHNHRDRVRSRGDARKTETPKTDDGLFTYSRTTIIRNGNVVSDETNGEPLSPEVQKEIDALFEQSSTAIQTANDSFNKVFDALNQQAKGKQ